MLSCYWEMLPVHVIRDLLTMLISDLAFDASSVNVRVAVIQVCIICTCIACWLLHVVHARTRCAMK